MAVTNQRSTGLATRIFMGDVGALITVVAAPANMIAYVSDVSGLTNSASTVTGSEYANGTAGSGYTLNKAGVKSAGPVTLVLSYVTNDASMLRLRNAYTSSSSHSFVVEMGDTEAFVGSQYVQMTGSVGSFDISTGSDSLRQVTIRIDIEGGFTYPVKA
ncbi:hypothetical protein [Shewanella sp.]|uniref:hypothetical protein n=1 Tax=Shewanella sp. TaxID=50422 RepID=UPI004047A6C6